VGACGFSFAQAGCVLFARARSTIVDGPKSSDEDVHTAPKGVLKKRGLYRHAIFSLFDGGFRGLSGG
jgi:hypothetical protein